MPANCNAGIDLRPIDGPGFTGVDGVFSGGDQDTVNFVNNFFRDRLRPSERHPDLWDVTIIHDPAETEARLAAVAGDKYSYRDLDDYTDLIQRTLETVPLVSKVSRSGVLSQKIYLEYSQERLASYGVQTAALGNILSARNITLPGGALEVGGKNLMIDPSGEFKNEKEIGDVLVATSTSGAPVYLRDAVDILRAYDSPPKFLNFYTWRDRHETWRRTRAITLAVQMRSGEQIAQFGKAVDEALAGPGAAAARRPALARTSDQPLQVEENIELFMRSLYEAIVLVVLVALIGFWEWRSALLHRPLHPHHPGDDVRHDARCSASICSRSPSPRLIIALGLLVDDPVVAGDAIKRELAAGHPRLDRRLARTHQTGACDPVRHHHQHRGLPAVPDAERRHRPVYLQPAGGAGLLAGGFAAGLDDVHPAARLLPAAGAQESGTADRGTAPARLRQLLLPHRRLRR